MRYPMVVGLVGFALCGCAVAAADTASPDAAAPSEAAALPETAPDETLRDAQAEGVDEEEAPLPTPDRPDPRSLHGTPGAGQGGAGDAEVAPVGGKPMRGE